MKKENRIIRIVLIIFLSLTAAFNALGGIGTFCAAFLTNKFESMAPLLEYQWLYQLIVIITVIIAICGFMAVVKLTKREKGAYRNSLWILVAGFIVAYVHFFASMQLRGKAAPANMKMYLNGFTLVLFLIFYLPSLRELIIGQKEHEEPEVSNKGEIALILSGLLILSTPTWVQPWFSYLTVAGLTMIFTGLWRGNRKTEMSSWIARFSPKLFIRNR